MTWTIKTPQGNESLKIRWDVLPYLRGKGLDVGCGEGKPFPHLIGIDSGRDSRLFGSVVDPDILCDAVDMPFFTTGSLDFVFSSHLLEHIEDYKKALREWWRVIKQDGYLVLYLPHKDFYPRIGTSGANPDHKHDFLPEDIIGAMRAMREIGSWDLVVCEERDQKDEYSMLLVFKKTTDGHVESWKDPKPTKTCGICRFGAWGDTLQMTSILPGLKEQGYHITLYSTPQAFQVVKDEPLIDDVVLVDVDRLPNHWLGEYWGFLREKHTKFINLSESVEGQFLALPDKVVYHWPTQARHKVMNQNYGEALHLIAGVPYDKPLTRFVPTCSEKEWAISQRKELASPVIMWVLAGSSIHKLYPHVDKVMEWFLNEYPNANIITVGDDKCRDVIEPPWKDQPRILLRSAVWSIRETMTMARYCDLVIGPETGVMNSVSMEPVPKIVFLSHSSVENLTRDWVNTISLNGDTKCYPCHKMIYSFDQCVRDESGASKCMADIPAKLVMDAIKMTIPEQREVA